ncbi:MAG: alpha/beta fold hydrolase [Reyranella sp.]|nr:alpha/beta fold hydrolase [Reyranella sp.]
MFRLARIFAVFLLLTAMFGAAVVWVGIPYLERRWAFFPASSASAQLWQMPVDAMEVSFPTSDGDRLTGWFFGSKGPQNGITVLLLHGNEGVLPDYLPEVQILQTLGFNMLLFNYRGFGKSEGTTLGETTLDLDGAAALRYLTNERGIDPHAIALLGVSLGAAVAADLATTSPCRAVALLGAFASSREQVARLEAWRSKPWLPEFLLDFLSSPFDTLDIIDQANCPVLIIHGQNDRFVPIEQAWELYDAARPPKRLIVVPGGAHGLPTSEGRRYLSELASFFINRR